MIKTGLIKVKSIDSEEIEMTRTKIIKTIVLIKIMIIIIRMMMRFKIDNCVKI